MLYLHHGAPVVQALARRLLYLTRSVNVRDDHWDQVLHYHDQKEAIKKMNWRDHVEQAVDDADRVLVERQFGMTIDTYVKSSFEEGWFAPSGTSRQALIEHIHSLQRKPCQQ